MLKVGPNEAERERVILKLRAGQSYVEATAELRKSVEPDWFDRNEKHLADVAKNGESKPGPAALAPLPPDPDIEPATGAVKTKAKK